ncbi:MAG: tetratricopeptide repeat protein, partial [Candidatus Binatia bacterium]
ADFHMQSPHAEEFLFLAGQLAVKEKRGSETVRLFEKYLSRYRSDSADERGQRTLLALYHLGVTYQGSGNDLLARASLEQFLSRPRPAKMTFGEEGEGYSYASAKAQLLLGRMVEEEYSRVRIEPPIKENFSRKEKLLVSLVERLAQPVGSGLSPLATEASYRIGAAYEGFARAVEDSPRPPGLTEEERSEYDRLLEQQVRPYLVKAVNAYRVTVRASREKSIADDWVSRCRERLAAVAPRVYLRTPRPQYVSLEPVGEAVPQPLRSFAGAPVASGSERGFFGSLLANDTEARKSEFVKGLAAASASPADWEEAEAHFRKSADGGPPEAGYNAAVAALGRGKPAEAMRYLEEVGRRYPTFHPAIVLSAVLYD